MTKTNLSAKRNKKKTPHNPHAPRCQRKVCFNVLSSDGEKFLSPKQSLEVLKNRRHALDVLLAGENCDNLDLMKEREVICEEIKTCDDYMKKQARRMVNVRRSAKRNTVGTVLKNLPTLNEENLKTVLCQTEDLLVEAMANRTVMDVPAPSPAVSLPRGVSMDVPAPSPAVSLPPAVSMDVPAPSPAVSLPPDASTHSDDVISKPWWKIW